MRFIDYRKENSPNNTIEPRKERERDELNELLKVYFDNGGTIQQGAPLNLDISRKEAGFGLRWRDEH